MWGDLLPDCGDVALKVAFIVEANHIYPKTSKEYQD